MTATGALLLVAATAKPGGAVATKSPWLAHTFISSGIPFNMRDEIAVSRRTSAWPNSRCAERPSVPPSMCVISCMP